jgi:neutral trehalase
MIRNELRNDRAENDRAENDRAAHFYGELRSVAASPYEASPRGMGGKLRSFAVSLYE